MERWHKLPWEPEVACGLHSSPAVEGEILNCWILLTLFPSSADFRAASLSLLEGIPPCYGGKADHRETGAGGCAGHWAQLLMALGSSVASAGKQLRAVRRAERNTGPWKSVLKRCLCPREMWNGIKSESSLSSQVKSHAMHNVKRFGELSKCGISEIQMDWRKTMLYFVCSS